MGHTVNDQLRGEITLYGKTDGGGGDVTLNHSVPDLREVGGHGFFGKGNWNDEVTSFRVTKGIWKFWLDINYEGACTQEFGPGFYSDIRDYQFPKDAASAVELVRET